VQELVRRSEPILPRIEAQLDQRERALAKSAQDVDRLTSEYYRGIERERSGVRQEIAQLEARQARVEWVARDPAAIVEELAGCSAQAVVASPSAAGGIRVLNTIAEQTERAIESARERLDGECARRMDAIRVAQQIADGALRVQPGKCREADLLLVPIWYVEWRKTPDAQDHERKRLCYRLATPLRIVYQDGRRVERELYPALTRYLQAQPGLGEWTGEFEVDGEPDAKLARYARRHACLQEPEIEALEADMRELVGLGVYPPGYDQMVAKSRDDLSEWRQGVRS
jgi:hypothetical protein